MLTRLSGFGGFSMETTLRWLKQYVDFKVSASELEELFTMSGTECEDMIPVRETGDTAFKFEITSNRTDCYGVLGLAREIAAILGLEFIEPKADYATQGKDINALTSVALECQDLCPFYSAQLITGVKVQESPRWLLDYFETLSSVKSIRPLRFVQVRRTPLEKLFNSLVDQYHYLGYC